MHPLKWLPAFSVIGGWSCAQAPPPPLNDLVSTDGAQIVSMGSLPLLREGQAEGPLSLVLGLGGEFLLHPPQVEAWYPLRGVTVRLEGSSRSTLTNGEGRFRLPVALDEEGCSVFARTVRGDLCCRIEGREPLRLDPIRTLASSGSRLPARRRRLEETLRRKLLRQSLALDLRTPEARRRSLKRALLEEAR